MKTFYSFLHALCWVCLMCVALQAQNATPPGKIPQLTTDDVEGRPMPAPTPARANADNANATTANKDAGGANVPAVKAGARAMLTAAWKNMSTLKSGRIQLVYRTANNEKHSMYEFTGDDHAHMVSDGEEIIVVGSAAYMKSKEKGWRLATEEEVPKKAILEFKNLARNFTDIPANVQLSGEEMLGQAAMLKFQMSEQKGNVTTMWVGKADGLVYKVESVQPESKMQMTITISDHDANVPIQPPVQ
ncbi:MAG TPA: hypothetical protein VFZ34_32295 [Blastocatellia bacterium]|nr:hypothetical protein [Blastocatellia bacterium]